MVSRRAFFAEFGRALVANVADTWTQASTLLPEPAAQQTQRWDWLRPPGALGETDFLVRCTQCTACQEACPYGSIRRLGPEFGSAAETPAIIPSESPCYLCQDMPCISACEPKALRAIPRSQVRMGSAILNMAECYLSAGQPCEYCVSRCPVGSDAISFGLDGLPDVRSPGCVGCGVCDYLCPGNAITISRADQGAINAH